MGFWKRLTKGLVAVGIGALAIGLSGFTGGLSLSALGGYLKSAAFWGTFAKAFIIGTGLTAASILLAGTPEGDRQRIEALKTTIKSTSMDARYIFGETYINGLLTNVSGNENQDLGEINTAINAARLSGNNLTQARSYTNNPRNRVTQTFVLSHHAMESLEGIYLNGTYIPLAISENQRRDKGSYYVNRGKFNRRLRVYYNLTGDGVQMNNLSVGQLRVEKINYRGYGPPYGSPTYRRRDIWDVIGRGVFLNDKLVGGFYPRRGHGPSRVPVIRRRVRTLPYASSPSGPYFQWQETKRETYTISRPYRSPSDTFNGLSYCVIELFTDGNRNDENSNAGFWLREGIDLTNLQFHVRGCNSIKNPITNTEEYSQNPAGILQWILSNMTLYNEEEIDADSYREAFIKCEENNYEANGFSTTGTLESAIPSLAREMRGYVGLDGLIKMKATDNSEESGIIIEKEDIVATDDIQIQGAGSHLNEAYCEYRDSAIDYQANTVTVGASAPAPLRFARNLGTLEYVTSKEGAAKSAQWLLNNAKYSSGFTLTVYATDKFASLDLFSRVTINYPEIPAIHNKRYIVISLQATPQGTLVFQLEANPVKMYEGVI